MWKKKNQLQDQTTNLLKNYKYRSSSVTPLITNKKKTTSLNGGLFEEIRRSSDEDL